MRFSFRSRFIDFEDGIPKVMGILNVTPDSFSDGGQCTDIAVAVDRAGKLLEEGAVIVDIGGESTRPGHIPVSEEEELQRVVPVVKAIRGRYGTGPILSIDTSKTAVAEAALEAGADIINDVTALANGGDALCAVLKKYQAGCVLMHNAQLSQVGDCMKVIVASLSERLQYAIQQSQLPLGHFILDAGIGFGKDLQQNITCSYSVKELQKLGCPVLIGASRKSFLKAITQRDVHERDYATTAITTLAAYHGANLIRVHNVPAAIDAIKVAYAIRNNQRCTFQGDTP